MREPMESRKEQKRQSLLDAAYALFTEKGVAKTSVDEIVRGANVAKGTFYLYFHDKDQLLGQLVYNISAQVLEEAYEWLDERRTPDFVENVLLLLDYVVEYFKGQLAEYVDNLKNFRRKCEQLKKISLLNQKKLNCFAYDNGKLVFSVKGCGINGKELFQLLYEKYHIELEMENLTYGIAMTSICDKKEDFDELWKAISEIDKMCEEKEKENRSLNKAVNETKIAIQNQDKVEIEICDKNKPKIETKIHNHYKVIQEKENEQTIYPPKIIESWQCRGKAMETVELADSTGRVSGKYVMIYPPGVPILVPGEKILKETVENISQYLYNGYNVLGLSCNKIIVLKDL